MKKNVRQQVSVFLTGPATYGPVDNRVTLPTNGSFTVKSRVGYNPVCKPKDGPGPGTYNPCERINSNRGFSMGVRHSPYLMPVINSRDMI